MCAKVCECRSNSANWWFIIEAPVNIERWFLRQLHKNRDRGPVAIWVLSIHRLKYYVHATLTQLIAQTSHGCVRVVTFQQLTDPNGLLETWGCIFEQHYQGCVGMCAKVCECRSNLANAGFHIETRLGIERWFLRQLHKNCHREPIDMWVFWIYRLTHYIYATLIHLIAQTSHCYVRVVTFQQLTDPIGLQETWGCIF